MLQALAELLLMLRRQPAELRIVLERPLLFVGRQILVTTQPVAGVALLSPRALRWSWRRLLAVWLAWRGLISLRRRMVIISLRRARRGKSEHGCYRCRRQPLRHLSHWFQSFAALSDKLYLCFVRLLKLGFAILFPTQTSWLPTQILWVCRDFFLHRQLIKQLKIGIELMIFVESLQVAHCSAGRELLNHPIVP
jgi:hypothetical protein